MSHTAERLKRALKEFGDMVPEDVVRAAHAFMSDHAAALARARAEALEEAATEMDGLAASAKVEGDDDGADAYEVGAEYLRALITTPAPATIPVGTIRGVLGEALSLDDDGRPDFDEGWACAVMHVASKIDALGMPGGAAIAPSKDSIPVERVREVLNSGDSSAPPFMRSDEASGFENGWAAAIRHVEDCLGVPLDAKGDSHE